VASSSSTTPNTASLTHMVALPRPPWPGPAGPQDAASPEGRRCYFASPIPFITSPRLWSRASANFANSSGGM
jgi:hypothetical protein